MCSSEKLKKHGMCGVGVSVIVMVTDLLSDSTMFETEKRLERVDSMKLKPPAPPRAFRLKNPHLLIVSL